MPNDFYAASGTPSQGSFGSSAAVRAEFNAILAAFDKLPALAASAGRAVFVNAGGTALESSDAIVLDPVGGGVVFNVPVSFSGGAPFLAPDGAVATPGYAFSEAPGTGMRRDDTTNGLAWSIGGAEVLHITPAGHARLGGTPYAWGAALRALELGDGAVAGGGGATRLAQNLYYDGNAWRYKASASGSLIEAQSSGISLYSAAAGTAGAVATVVERLRVAGDGRVSGRALHNNPAAVTGTTDQYVASGTYPPVLTAVQSVANLSATSAQWLRVGNVVTASGSFSLSFNSTADPAILRMSIPIPSAFALASNAGGTAPEAGAVFSPWSVLAVPGTALVELRTNAIGPSGVSTWSFTFTYVIL